MHAPAITLTPRALGRTGLLVPPIGLGTVKLGRNTAVKYPAAYALPDDRAAIELLAQARALGVNLLDTAPAYGVAEQRIGDLLASVRELGGRDAWTIATKAGESFDPATGVSSFDFSHAGITRSIHRSLERLRTDRLDIALLHSDGNDESILRDSGGLDALRELRRRGLVRAVGISTKTPGGAMLAAEMCDVVMLTINPLHDADAPAAAEAERRGVGVLVKKALLSGHVGADGSRGWTAEACLAHALACQGVGAVIVGTLSPAHLRANAAGAARAMA